jgi:hypothetical protein
MFRINNEQQEKIDKWLKEEVYPPLLEQQKQSLGDKFNQYTDNGQYPYCGACGGNLTYSFTPTTLGVVVKVYESLSRKTLDLTDYYEW